MKRPAKSFFFGMLAIEEVTKERESLASHHPWPQESVLKGLGLGFLWFSYSFIRRHRYVLIEKPERL